MKNLLLVLAVIALMASCNDPGSRLYYNQSFEEASAAARKADKPLCIVLVDHLQYVSGEYVRILQENQGDLSGRAVFNIADIEEPANEWYVKWLCPVAVPLTCVFSAGGDLIDLIPGMGEESFEHIAKSLRDGAPTEYRWDNRFDLDKAKAVSVLGAVLRNREYASHGIYAASSLDASTGSLKYPYNLWLKMAGLLMTGDTLSAKTTARELLELGTPYNLATYRAEFITANKVVNPGFETGDEPNIRVVPDRIMLGERPLNKLIPIEIMVYNDGRKQLTVSKAATSCSCLRHLGGGDAVVVAPGDSVRLSFALSPPGEGGSFHEIMLVSDAINSPLLNIDIMAEFRRDL